MNTIDQLNREFSAQEFPDEHPGVCTTDRFRELAEGYARMENAIAVLSDLRSNVSHIYYGGFSKQLGLETPVREGTLPSIWEEEIFRLIHPDDLAGKHLQELCFYHFIKKQPRKRRAEYYLMSQLRMKGATGSYLPVLHRMFYVSSEETLWLALCLYSPLVLDLPARCLIVNSVNGHTTELEAQHRVQILSGREKQILTLIDKGMTSKEIAGMLCISVNTVSRHRQEILARLQVKNSIEACRMAKELKLL